MTNDTVPASNKHPATWLWQLLAPDRSFYRVAITYSLAISLLTLSVPIAVQTLINTLANVASIRAIIVLAILLFLTLLVSGALTALRTRTMEYFERRIYARLTAEVSLHTIYARHEYFEGRRNTDITNRYFDIMTLQKNVPFLLVDGFALVLQMLVGFSLVSFYHPILLMFNIGVILALILFWKLWGRSAVSSAVALSHAKYEMSKWLDSLAYAHEFFKSTRHIDYAVERTDSLTNHYVSGHRKHFKYTFAQTISFLLLYAVASASLLGIGGWLVIIGQLSMGQLVAAELILSAILFGLSKMADYLKNYYEMCGAADELGQVFSIPQENIDNSAKHALNGGALVFDQVRLHDIHNTEYMFNFKIPANVKVLAHAEKSSTHRAIIHLLKRHTHPSSGSIQLAGCDLEDLDVYHLRQDVVVIDRSPIVECSIEDYLRMSCPAVSLSEIRSVLKHVGIKEEVENLPDGLKTLLSPLGDPLSPVSFLHLKLAACLLTQPKILVLTQFFDLLNPNVLEQTLSLVSKLPMTVLYFTKQVNHPIFDHRLLLEEKQQKLTSGNNASVNNDNTVLAGADND
ncbi:ABC transporter transmembrane domain-containing protein [Agarilytica rhodophyticola]|uniref:ABC transporter transmembrane domain-containing protein n=1 Tax=Agarilytica rhodophyticola TaxID=1737490 RepID=UPI000B343FFE|nr:ABC transporter ATP-binding protein [Agarilytica rhodophyticola]